jgi:hypothetical protein
MPRISVRRVCSGPVIRTEGLWGLDIYRRSRWKPTKGLENSAQGFNREPSAQSDAP